MRDVLKQLPVIGPLLSWGWHLAHLRRLVSEIAAGKAHLDAVTQELARLHQEVSVLQQEGVAMKQDLTVLRQENAELRGLGIVVPRIEAQDATIEKIRQDLDAHRDSAHQLHEKIRRDLLEARKN